MNRHLAVALWFLLALGVFYRGHLYSKDAVAKIETARSLLDHGDFDVSPQSGGWGVRGRDNKDFAYFPLGSVLLMVPGVAAENAVAALRNGARIPHVAGVVVTAQNLLATALCGVMIWALLLRLGAGRRRAFLVANAIVFCTELLPYSSSDWSEPPALALSLAAVLALVRTDRRPGIAPWAIYGAVAGLSTLIRLEMLLFHGAAVFLLAKGEPEESRGTGAARAAVTRWLPPAIALGAMAAVFCLNLWYNNVRYGSILDFGYIGHGGAASPAADVAGIASRAAHAGFWMHAYAVLLSFGKVHWFWAAPILALIPLSLMRWRDMPRPVRALFFAGAVAVAAAVFQGSNSWCWANRYLYTAIVFLSLPLAWMPRLAGKTRAAVAAVAVAGAAIAGVGSAVNYHLVLERLVDKEGYAVTMGIRPYSVALAPVWQHAAALPGQAVATGRLSLGLLADRSWPALRARCLDLWPVGLCAMGAPPWLAFIAWLGLCAAAWRWWRAVDKTVLGSRSSPERGGPA